MEMLSCHPDGFYPGILLDKESESFQIFGTSCPSNAIDFYDPVFNWFEEYIKNPLQKTVLDLNLTYFNTISGKLFLRLFTKLDKLSDTGFDVLVRWHYSEDDYDMREEGEEFESILKCKFEFISVKEGGKI